MKKINSFLGSNPIITFNNKSGTQSSRHQDTFISKVGQWVENTAKRNVKDVQNKPSPPSRPWPDALSLGIREWRGGRSLDIPFG